MGPYYSYKKKSDILVRQSSYKKHIGFLVLFVEGVFPTFEKSIQIPTKTHVSSVQNLG